MRLSIFPLIFSLIFALFVLPSSVSAAPLACDYAVNGDSQCSPPSTYCMDFSCQSVANATLFCEDPDGFNLFTSATVSYRYRDYNGRFISGSSPDQCLQNNIFVNSCTGAGCNVREVACANPSAGVHNFTTVSCTGGCTNGACTASCSDGVRNQDEAGVDCGGAYCQQCQPRLDVNVGTADPGNHNWSVGENENNSMLQLQFTGRGTWITLTQITIQASGTGHDVEDLQNVFAAIDSNSNGRYDVGESILARGAYGADNGTFVINLVPPVLIGPDQTIQLNVIYRMRTTPSQGETFGIQLFSYFANSSGTTISANVASNLTFSNIKTIPIYQAPDLCRRNGVRDFDEQGVDCGGAYCQQCQSSLQVNIGPADPGDHEWRAGDNENNTMIQLQFTSTNGTSYVNQVTVTASGSGNDVADIRNVFAAIDSNGNGRYDAGEQVIGRGAYGSDNGTFVINFVPTVAVPPGSPVYVIIVYQMGFSASGGETFTLQVFSYFASSISGNLANNQTFSNTKTIPTYTPPDLCRRNGVQDFDEQGVDCGGAYCPRCDQTIPSCYDRIQNQGEYGVDCGGPCPTCIPDICQPTPTCDPSNPPVCNSASRTVSICISGIWSTTSDGYDQFCPSTACTPGTTTCDYQRRTVTTCLPSGEWGQPLDLESLYNLYCENRGCDEGESYCAQDGSLYECRNGQWDGDASCQPSERCNPGEVYCSSNQMCDEQGELVPASPEAQASCAQPDGTTVCDNTDTRCMNGGVELCENNQWTVHPTPSAEQVENCRNRTCNNGWFACNPVERTISFCAASGQWGAGQEQGYTTYCEQQTITLGGDAPSGVQFATGVERIIIGEIRNNSIIKIVSLPSIPKPKPPLLAQALQTPSLVWIVLVIIALASAGIAVYFYKKFNDLANDESKPLGKRK